MATLRSPRFYALSLSVALLATLALTGCGPHKTPREIETGANAGEETPTPSPAASGKVATNDADAFPSIALDIPPPADTPGVDAAETAATKSSSPEAALNLGFAYYKEAAYGQAVDQFQKAALALKLGKAATAYFYSGLSSMGAGDLNGAVTTLDKAANVSGADRKTQSLAYLEIGRARFQQKRDADAKSAFEKSLSLDPHQGEAQLAMGTYAAIDQKYASAKTFFEAAAKDLKPGRVRAQAFSSLGLLAEKANDKAGAIAQYKKAIADNPRNAPASEALARLKK